MITFRQKIFNNTKVLRELGEKSKLVNFFNKNKSAISAGTGIVGGGIGATNLSINLKRRDNEEQFQKDQIEATRRLADALEGLDLEDDEVKEEIKRRKKLFKKSQRPYVRDRYLPEPIEMVIEETKKSKKKKKKKND